MISGVRNLRYGVWIGHIIARQAANLPRLAGALNRMLDCQGFEPRSPSRGPGVSMQRWCGVLLLVATGLFAAGCPKGSTDYNKGRKAETLQDYDAALNFYEKALKSDPNNAAYKIRVGQARFEAASHHVKEGLRLKETGDLQGAAAQFQRAQAIDPSSSIAADELKKTLALLAEQNKAAGTPPTEEDDSSKFLAMPPQIKPLSPVAVNLKMINADSRAVFDTIGKLAGLTVIYDPDYPARKISVELNNVTLEQALDVASFESKAFVKPLTENIIMVIQDQTQKRRDYEEEVLKTFYMSNTVTPQDLTEIVTGLRQLTDVKRIVQINSQNAIAVRATPDMLELISKVINDIDKAKPEVVVQVEVLEARTDRLRNLGVSPGQSASIAINPNSASSTSTTTGSTTTPTNNITLNNLRHLTATIIRLRCRTLLPTRCSQILTQKSFRIRNCARLTASRQNSKSVIVSRSQRAASRLAWGWAR